MSRAQIRELLISGFQVFAEPCRVPFGRMTLLFGSGSSGKTSVGAALSVIHQYASVFKVPGRNQPEDLGEHLARLLDQRWRMMPGKTGHEPLTLAPDLELQLVLNCERQAWAAHAMAKRRRGPEQIELIPAERRYEPIMAALVPWFKAEESFELGFQIQAERPVFGGSFLRSRSRQPGGASLRHVACVLIQAEPVLRVDSHGAIALRLSHPVFGGRLDAKALSRLTVRYPGQVAADADWISVVGGDHLRSIGLATGTLAGLTRQENPGALLDADDLTCFSLLEGCINGLWLSTTRLVSEATHLVPVAADRSAPTLEELTFLMDGTGLELPPERMGVSAKGRSEFANLAAEGLWECVRIAGREDMPRPMNLRSELDHVNRLLSEVLYRERGLYLSFEVNEFEDLLQPGESLVGHLRDNPESRGVYMVKLKISDAEGRRLPLSQVGSGVAQSLPVVLALASGRGTWVQYPEQQLHPAMQAQMADAFLLSGAAQDAQHLLETHSEILLLRLLRRIRQSSLLEDVRDPALKLLPQDLCLVHIGPSADGVTRTKHLRVSADGEVIDRWPGGFFDERWQELFNE